MSTTPPVSGNPTGTTVLTPNNPTVTSETPTVSISVPNGTGTLTFQLIVTDNLGVQSAPVTATVTIQGNPTGALKATPSTIAVGQTITLDGSGSAAAAPGTLSSYAFTLVAPAG